MLTDVIRSAPRSWYLARRLFTRNWAREYRHALFSWVGAIIPLLATVAWCALMSSARILNVDTVGVPYSAYVMVGLMLWMTLADAVLGPVQGLSEELSVISQSQCPPEAIALGRVLENLYHFGFKLVLIAVVVWWCDVSPGMRWLLAPLGVLGLVALGSTVGLALAPLGILFRDLPKTLSALTTFVMFLSPVLYQQPQEGLASWVMWLNPASPLVAGTRECFFGLPLSRPWAFAGVALGAMVVVPLAAAAQRRLLPLAIEKANV